MKNNLSTFFVGFIFALGLGISGMSQPQKVFSFLDVFGSWDPSLVFVMIGAIAVHIIAYKLIIKRKAPLFDVQWHLPSKKELSPALIGGSLIFGIGWGLAGFCPGPGLTALASFELRPILFVSGMLVGMFLFRQLDRRLKIKR